MIEVKLHGMTPELILAPKTIDRIKNGGYEQKIYLGEEMTIDMYPPDGRYVLSLVLGNESDDCAQVDLDIDEAELFYKGFGVMLDTLRKVHSDEIELGLNKPKPYVNING